MDLVARILLGMSCLHPISGNFVAPGGTWNVWSSKHINPEIAARQHLEWQELTREGKETESLTGLTGGLEKNSWGGCVFWGEVGEVRYRWGWDCFCWGLRVQTRPYEHREIIEETSHSALQSTCHIFFHRGIRIFNSNTWGQTILIPLGTDQR